MKRKPVLVLALLLVLSLLTSCAEEAATASTEVVLYLPTTNATGLAGERAAISGEVTPQVLIDALCAGGALPENIAVLAFSQEGSQLKLDLSASFGEALRSTGTAGERLYLGSLTDTLLAAYGAESLVLTCTGTPLETGHNVYDEPLTFFEATQPPALPAATDTTAPTTTDTVAPSDTAQSS